MRIVKNDLSFHDFQSIECARFIEEICETGKFSLGKFTDLVESEFIYPDRCLTVCNGTIGLQLIYSVMREMDRIFVPTLTVPMVSRAVIPTKAFVTAQVHRLFVGGLHCLTEASFRNVTLTPNDAVVFVATGGLVSFDFLRVVELVRSSGAFLILDLSHAHSGKLDGKSLHEYGDAAVWSCYATKAMTSGGEGGIVWFKDPELMKRASAFANQGKVRGVGQVTEFGLNFRMSEVNAAIMYSEILHRDIHLETMKKLDDRYLSRGVSGLHREVDGLEISYYKFIVDVPRGMAPRIEELMREKGVFCSGRVHSSLDDCDGYIKMDSVADEISVSHVCLPMHRKMTNDDVDFVSKVFHECMLKECVEEIQSEQK